nr:hypothetical protein [uncultured bacterium]
MERVKRFELSTSTLARSRSTTELHPHCESPKGQRLRALFAIVKDLRQEFFHKNFHRSGFVRNFR